MSSRSTADLLTIVSDKLLGLLYEPGATRTVTLEISKAFDRVCNASLFHKLKYYGNSGRVFGLVLSFVINRQLWMVLGGNFSQDYSVNAGAPKIPFVVLKFS